jgi:hypothetical protein
MILYIYSTDHVYTSKNIILQINFTKIYTVYLMSCFSIDLQVPVKRDYLYITNVTDVILVCTGVVN